MTAPHGGVVSLGPGATLAAVASTSAVVLVTALSLDGPAAFITVLAFTTLVPGWVISHLLGLPLGGASRLAVAMGLSLAVMAEVALVMLLVHRWHPSVGLYLVAAGVYVGLAVAVRRAET